MSDQLVIRSYRHKYTVQFVASYADTLQQHLAAGDQLIVDENLVKFHPALATALAGFPTIYLTPTEPAKSYEAIGPIIQQLITRRFTRSNRLVAIGGGIIQDITAFTASILFRGVDWIFFPTNLLTQCDSCIGSKTSINFGPYKNQLGGFFPPKAVYIDLAFLDTLPPREIQSGLGEMLHYFLVTGEADFQWGAARLDRALQDRTALRELIHRSLSIKKAMIERDEFDQGPRNVFNYGHSFGHALESMTRYAVPHGIAVSYGMDLANVISSHRGLIPLTLRNQIRPCLAKVWQATPLEHVDCAAFLAALAHDKKNEGKEIKVILTKGIGQMFKTTLTLDAGVRQLIERYFAEKLYATELSAIA